MSTLIPTAEIEARILAMLAEAPMTQLEIECAFPMDYYLIVPKVVRDLDARGLVVREPHGRTKLVRLNTVK